MSSTTHTDNSKSGRYKTLVLIIGVLVALMIGLSLSASAFNGYEIVSTEVPGRNSLSAIITALKMGSVTFKGVFSI